MPELHFFLGANTPQGFVSRFDQLSREGFFSKIYLLKGGPGTGKSGILRKAAAAVSSEERTVEQIHCASDAQSLDAVLFEDLGIAVADATTPHVIEPKYPGCLESVIWLDDCWNASALRNSRDEIIPLFDREADCRTHSARFLAAAESILNDSSRIVTDYLNEEKLTRFAKRLIQREIKPATGDSTERIRFLSAITSQGVVLFEQTAATLCDTVWVIDDDYGAVSRRLLSMIRCAALSQNQPIITCYCPMSPFEKLEHLFLPQLKIGFMTSNHYHPLSPANGKIIHAKRFLDNDKLREKKKRLSFNRKAAQQLIEEAMRILGEAKHVHGLLEKTYQQATDYLKVDRKAETLLTEIRRQQEQNN